MLRASAASAPWRADASTHPQRSPPALTLSTHPQHSPPVFTLSAHSQCSPPALTPSLHPQRSLPALTLSTHPQHSPSELTPSAHSQRSPPVFTPSAQPHGCRRRGGNTSRTYSHLSGRLAAEVLHGPLCEPGGAERWGGAVSRRPFPSMREPPYVLRTATDTGAPSERLTSFQSSLCSAACFGRCSCVKFNN